ncbi:PLASMODESMATA CALLOSE-BINDING PROTEIN 1-like isoform X1 [Triticum dicoccoides]|uniref:PLASMODESMATA CALLOSE-BINDING PROTEIN 1-like isoform X1 n=1 Tax=Triticum dicoccoides TaxID=85692 RepID=UPI00188F95FC|nr:PLASMODESMATA CALLOSE-BINDING PROTEIN 1-like isoform X1 [Triticum dicoccoides]
MRRRRSPVAALWLAAAWALQLLAGAGAANPTWCIVRTGAPVRTVQAALDYACSPAGGADCAPIQPSALCYLPNTLAAHASYAFNSVYQRSHAAPGACDFAGTATVTLTDPSYGSCTFPASPGTAGSPGSATSASRPPPGNRKPDLGSDDDDSDTDEAHVATANAPLMSLALSCFVYLHLRWW